MNENHASVLFSIPLDNLLDHLAERLRPVIQQEIAASGHLTKPSIDTHFLTRKEVASRFKITPKTVHQWIKSGKLKAYRINSRVLFKAEEVDNAVKAVRL